jgi:hypothetical protein
VWPALLRTPADRGHFQCYEPPPIGKGHAPGIETGLGATGAGAAAGLAAGFLGAAFLLAAGLSFFPAAFFLTADLLRAGRDFLAASPFFFLVVNFFFATFFFASFFFALAIYCLLSGLKGTTRWAQ